MNRAHNFNAGPAILPVEVVQDTAEAVVDFAGTGMGIMEVSHRSKEFDAVIKEAQNDLLTIMNLPKDEYTVLFLGGGASTQFLMVPYNFMHSKSDYVVTGAWAKKASKEAKMFGTVNIAASSDDKNFNYLPKEFNFSPDADYIHITTNNTIYGTEWKTLPETGNIPLVADMSSDFLALPHDFAKCSLIYAGAQKNIGPSGVTVVIVKNSWLAENGKDGIPTMMSYKTHADNESLFNTPPCLPIYVVNRTFKWIMKQGGLEAVHENNKKKASVIYDMIDNNPDFYKGTVTNKDDRSMMNITFNLPTPELEALFIAEAKELKMIGLKGHRSVGGVRASVYNACPIESAEALAKFMTEFYSRNK